MRCRTLHSRAESGDPTALQNNHLTVAAAPGVGAVVVVDADLTEGVESLGR